LLLHLPLNKVKKREFNGTGVWHQLDLAVLLFGSQLGEVTQMLSPSARTSFKRRIPKALAINGVCKSKQPYLHNA